MEYTHGPHKDEGERDWGDGATAQGILAASRNWKKQGTDSPVENTGGTRPVGILAVAQ